MGEMAHTTQKANLALDLQRRIVGVKLLGSGKEYEVADAEQLRHPIHYCVMVKLACLGYARKATLKESRCLSAARVLGMTPPEEKWLSGETYTALKMYENLENAKKVVRNTTSIRKKMHGVMTKPLELYNEPPDIVLVITTPYNAMRLLQGYTYKFGTYKDFKVIGNQAICSESTAYPYESDDINLSMMCTGTRYYAGWGKEEMAVGIPYPKFVKLVDGLYDTINIMEKNEDKRRIEQRLTENGIDDLSIRYNWNYFNDIGRTQQLNEE